MAIADQFAGLPIEDLIVAPLTGMAKGQAKLNDVTWKYISEVAFVKNEKTKKWFDIIAHIVILNINFKNNPQKEF